MTEELLAFRLTAAGTFEEYGVEFSGVCLEGDDDAVKAAASWIGDYVTLSRGVLCASSQEADTIARLTAERDEAVRHVAKARAENARLRSTPTVAETWSACLSYRHDFGLLGPDQRLQVAYTALEWLHAWDKARGGQGIDMAAARAALRTGEDGGGCD